MTALQDAARQVIFDGADHRGGLAGRAQHRIDQVRGGGLAVGAGDAGEKQAFVGPAEEIARRQRQRLAAVRHLNPAAGEIGGRGGFAGHGHGAARQRIGRELASVGLTAGEGKEERLPGRRAANRTRSRQWRTGRVPAQAAEAALHPKVFRRDSSCKLYADAFSLVQRRARRRRLYAGDAASVGKNRQALGGGFGKHGAHRHAAKIGNARSLRLGRRRHGQLLRPADLELTGSAARVRRPPLLPRHRPAGPHSGDPGR